MTFYDYMQKLFVNGVPGLKTIVENDHKGLTLNDDSYQAIMVAIRLSNDKAFSTNQEIMPGLTTSMLRTQIVYDLYRLDKLKFRLDAHWTPNVTMPSRIILSYLTRADMRMRNFPSLDAKSYFTAIIVSIAILYCMSVGKPVEAKLLAKLNVQDMRAQELYDTFERAQSILNDVRKYNNRAAFYDARLLYFMPKENANMASSRPPAF